ncbi:MAG: hypothetical protein H0U10_04450 [Chloroflexia bacterium]|nr:hypothetical protein [Chloroflexia bacterium]
MLARQVAMAGADRDLPTEIGTAAEGLAAAVAAVAGAEKEQQEAAEALTATLDGLAAIRALERRDSAARQLQQGIEGAASTARVVADNAQRSLGELDEAERVGAGLAVVAAGLAGHDRAVAGHEADRERAHRANDLLERQRQAEGRLETTARKLATTVGGVGGGGRIDGWVWTAADAADPRGGARRLLAVVAALETEDACRRAADLVRCRVLMTERDRAERTLATYVERRANLEGDRKRLLAGGDPRQALETARVARGAAMEGAAAAAASVTTARREAARAEGIIANLRHQHLDQPCPTCYRPFDPDEVASMVALQEEQRGRSLAAAETAEGEARLATDRSRTAERAERAESAAIEELAGVEGAIEKSKPYLDEAAATAAAQALALRNGLAECGFAAEPTPAEVDEAERYATLLQTLEKAGGAVSMLETQAAAAEHDRDEAAALLTALGAADYDSSAHQAARDALAAARLAAGRVEEIDLRLAGRPGLERERETALAEMGRLTAEAVQAEAARLAIGFDPAALTVAEAAEQTARGRERTATGALGDARQLRREAERTRDRLLGEAEELRDLTERAETRRREAADLERMQKEFGRFDQYVANLVGPLLADRTGEFLAEVTDGKYNRVAFDQDYGLRIYDEEDAFPVERFSGGERDVAALCARLALSTMIGAQAAHPPRFAVLDEVFGSLDEDRRTQVLGTLGKLAETSEALRQLFIISHVEDVHSSPVVSEVWRVTEVEGVSRVQQDDRRALALTSSPSPLGGPSAPNRE